jgi:hypothetical protein
MTLWDDLALFCQVPVVGHYALVFAGVLLDLAGLWLVTLDVIAVQEEQVARRAIQEKFAIKITALNSSLADRFGETQKQVDAAIAAATVERPTFEESVDDRFRIIAFAGRTNVAGFTGAIDGITSALAERENEEAAAAGRTLWRSKLALVLITAGSLLQLAGGADCKL